MTFMEQQNHLQRISWNVSPLLSDAWLYFVFLASDFISITFKDTRYHSAGGPYYYLPPSNEATEPSRSEWLVTVSPTQAHRSPAPSRRLRKKLTCKQKSQSSQAHLWSPIGFSKYLHTLYCLTYWENKSEVGFSKYTSCKDRSVVRDPVVSWKGTKSKEMPPHNPIEGTQIAVTVSVNMVGADSH